MQTSNLQDFRLFHRDLIDVKCVQRIIAEFFPPLSKFARNPADSTPSKDRMEGMHISAAFDVYLRYLNHYDFHYTLRNDHGFWKPGKVNVPEGNCQTVAQSFLDLLWALSVDPRHLYMHRVSIDGVERLGGGRENDLEKIVTKPLDLIDDSKVCRAHRWLLGRSRGTRCFRVNRTTGNLEAITDHPRNPFRFHMFCYVPLVSHMPYFDARTGLRYKTGGGDYFQGYKRGPVYAYTAGRPAAASTAPEYTAEMYYDQIRPGRRIYRMTEEMDKQAVVRAGVGAYDDGGNWIFTSEDDWAGTPGMATPQREGLHPPGHIQRLYTGPVFRWQAQDLSKKVSDAALDGQREYNRKFPAGQTVIKRLAFVIHNKTTSEERIRTLLNALKRPASPNVSQVLGAGKAFFDGSTSWKDASLNLLVARNLLQAIRRLPPESVTPVNARARVDDLLVGLRTGAY